jgi:cell wall-associated NlpC family hydrolase
VRRPPRHAAVAARPVPAAASAGGSISPGAPTDAEVRAELRQLYGQAGGADPAAARTVALSGGLAAAPPDAPERLQRIVAAANQVARLPYVYGGGHGGGEGLWVDSAYDCSGSVSFALANAGYLDSPLDSTGLAHFGKPGRGRWVTIYANAGHAFMVVGGARFDTVGLRQSGSRWQPARSVRSISGFTARHPPGL